jgi:hypothetical protein
MRPWSIRTVGARVPPEFGKIKTVGQRGIAKIHTTHSGAYTSCPLYSHAPTAGPIVYLVLTLD